MNTATTQFKPFDGVRVLDMSQGLAGPYAAQMLLMMGATVVKVEPPQGDWGRVMGLARNGHSALSVIANWGKKGICVDARNEQGREVIKRLVGCSDLVMESFRPGVMEKLGLGYDVLKSLNPGIVLGSISGFGRSGPHALRAGSDSILQAATGMAAMNGTDEGAPRRVGMLAVDMITGLYAGYALSAAIHEQRASGVGRHLDLSLLGASMAFQAMPMVESFLQGGEKRKPVTVPSGNFDAADGQLSVVCLRNEMFHALAKALGHEEWATDPRFADNEARQRNVDTLHDLLAGIFPTQSREYWINRLNQAGVLCGPVNSYSSLREDAQVEALHLLADVDHPDFGAFPFPAFPGAQRAADELPPAPALGQHTVDALRGAGFAEAEIHNLLSSGACMQA
ncbi:acyl-CoA transferase [Alcanivorax balearicus MACL04]|uniref:Acyl-CoA transferase n=1 Tax=Alloalcanivorax balearicus MACL04 TaxID=1177182 RepID=A0ABT2QXB4_9GAMM|nr:CoA transferase [Alloalcanivorax balearicus]MCU5782151.1 acyl-CoA transferase [Alloalcanivorax balearicus MACL04]